MRAAAAPLFWVPVLLSGCAALGGGDGARIGSLNDERVSLEEERVQGSLEKAMTAYRRFLEEAPETEMTPEAMRRLADLKVEASEAGLAAGGGGDGAATGTGARDGVEGVRLEGGENGPGGTRVESDLQRPPRSRGAASGPAGAEGDRSVAAMQKRAVESGAVRSIDRSAAAELAAGAGAQGNPALAANAEAEEAIRLYRELLARYPGYERNDEVLYQLSRAYEFLGRREEAMATLDRIVAEYPDSRRIDEVYFRRGEIRFVRENYVAAERNYERVIAVGKGSEFYTQSLYKHGWSLFKQGRYREALGSLIPLLAIRTADGSIDRDDKIKRQRLEDALRIVSLTFSYLGGWQAVAGYFEAQGGRPFEDLVYEDLGEHYFKKRRFSDAAETFAAYAERHPMDPRAPHFHRRVIEVYREGGFPRLVLQAKRDFARRYAPDARYWEIHDIEESPKILAFVRSNMVDLARHYHARSQQQDGKPAHVREAVTWYRAFLKHFPKADKAPELNFLLAELLYENARYAEAATEYERTAYGYAEHEKVAAAGFSAVLAHRGHHEAAPEARKPEIFERALASSLRFADTFRDHPKAPAVQTRAAEDLFQLDRFADAEKAARILLQRYPEAEGELRRSAWIVVGHASFNLQRYADAEKAYQQALGLTAKRAEDRHKLVDRLAASVYKQAEAAEKAGERKKAVEGYLRVARVAPGASIRATAEYDAAALLIRMESWQRARRVLERFRERYPEHELQGEVTKKLALVYREAGQPGKAAEEFAKIAAGAGDRAVARDALRLSAELYEEAGRLEEAVDGWQRFARRFPEPFEASLEARHRVAQLYDEMGRARAHRRALQGIVAGHEQAGAAATDRTRYLAAKADLELTEPLMEAFREVELSHPLERSLPEKKRRMERALDAYSALTDYGVAEVTAAATYKIAALYYHLSQAILDSDRPDNLSKLELEQYNLLLEEQAYPFEEKAIGIHEKNLELLGEGIYNDWIQRSIVQLGKLMPARYAKAERSEDVVTQIH